MTSPLLHLFRQVQALAQGAPTVRGTPAINISQQNVEVGRRGDPPGIAALTCNRCGQDHQAVTLQRGQRASCVRCDGLLARKSWLGPAAPLAMTITGIMLAVPAMLLPLASFSKFGQPQPSFVFTGVIALWQNGMPLLAVWTALCGIVTPLLLLGALVGILVPRLVGRAHRAEAVLIRIARALEHWAMPEVHLLAVLVSFIRLGSLVDVQIEAGLWCYASMSIAILAAWRTFGLEPTVVAGVEANTILS